MLNTLLITWYPYEWHFRAVFEAFSFAWKKVLGKTVTCELIKSQRPLSSWMAFPLWHERGSLEAPSRRWPWRLGIRTPSDQTGLFSGVRTALEPSAIEKREFACGSVLQQASLAFLKNASSIPVNGLSCWEAYVSAFVLLHISALL